MRYRENGEAIDFFMSDYSHPSYRFRLDGGKVKLKGFQTIYFGLPGDTSYV
jgi:hypothetical protein